MTPDVIELLNRHPSIHYTGSVEGMKNLGYWGEDDVCARVGDYIYNLSIYLQQPEERNNFCRRLGCKEYCEELTPQECWQNRVLNELAEEGVAK